MTKEQLIYDMENMIVKEIDSLIRQYDTSIKLGKYPQQGGSIEFLQDILLPHVKKIKEIINAQIDSSKKWIEDYVEKIKEWDDSPRTIHDYDDLMKSADNWVSSDYDKWLTFSVDNERLNFEPLCCLFQGVNQQMKMPNLIEEFWHHYEIVTGKKVEEDKKMNFFKCAC